MADITFGGKGDPESYYPIARSETRVDVDREEIDIMRLPTGNGYNKLYFPSSPSGFEHRQSDVFMEPNSVEDVTLTKTGDFNQDLTHVGFRRGQFAYRSYSADTASTTNFASDYRYLNHKAELEYDDEYVAVDGMNILFNMNLPGSRVTRSQHTSSIADYEQSDVAKIRYTFTSVSNSGDRVEISMSPLGYVNGFDNIDDEHMYIRMTVYKDGEKIIDSPGFINRDGIFATSGDKLEFNNVRYNLPKSIYELWDYKIDRLHISDGSARVQAPPSVSRIAGDFRFVYKKGSSSLFVKFTRGTTNNIDTTVITEYNVKIWQGDLGINLDRFKIKCEIISNTTKVYFGVSNSYLLPVEILSGYCRVLYPNLHDTYEVNNKSDVLTGQVRIYDDNGSDDNDDWTRVLSRDYRITGKTVLDNRFVTVRIGEVHAGKPVIRVRRARRDGRVLGYLSNSDDVFAITPMNDDGSIPSRLTGVVFRHVSHNQVIVDCRYGDLVYTLTLGRGMPYVNLKSNGNKIAVHRSLDYVGQIDNFVVPAYKRDYTVVTPTFDVMGVTASQMASHNDINYGSVYNYGSSGLSSLKAAYAYSSLNPIDNMFDNWIGWTRDNGQDYERYCNWMCFIRRPTSIVKSISPLSSYYIQTVVTFDKPARVALGHIESFRFNNEETKKFIRLTNECMSRIRETNFIRRRD